MYTAGTLASVLLMPLTQSVIHPGLPAIAILFESGDDVFIKSHGDL